MPIRFSIYFGITKFGGSIRVFVSSHRTSFLQTELCRHELTRRRGEISVGGDRGTGYYDPGACHITLKATKHCGERFSCLIKEETLMVAAAAPEAPSAAASAVEQQAVVTPLGMPQRREKAPLPHCQSAIVQLAVVPRGVCPASSTTSPVASAR